MYDTVYANKKRIIKKKSKYIYLGKLFEIFAENAIKKNGIRIFGIYLYLNKKNKQNKKRFSFFTHKCMQNTHRKKNE